MATRVLALNDDFSVHWNDISYLTKVSFIDRLRGKEAKEVLRNVSGHINRGEMTAIMGPSGAGKSTLLEIIARMRQRGVLGSVLFQGSKRAVNIAFVPQYDKYLDYLTAGESLLFASKVQNATKNFNDENYKPYLFEIDEDANDSNLAKSFHDKVVKNILEFFSLEPLKDVMVKDLSGGQKKRLSIAQELVSAPDIIVLDEPTTGLDSTTAYNCVQKLSSLTQKLPPLTVVCTIHQPNPKTFLLFNKVYVLSNVGKCVYEGSPQDLVNELANYGIDCPPFYNPADFIIELAAGEYGIQTTSKLIQINQTKATIMDIADSNRYIAFKRVTKKPKFPTFYHFICLIQRSFLLTIRNRTQIFLRGLTFVGSALFLSYLFGGKTGEATGCPVIEGSIKSEAFAKSIAAALEEKKSFSNNLSLIFCSYFLTISGTMLLATSSLITEMPVLLKETRNNWYEGRTYHLASTICDLPFQLLLIIIYITIVYLLTNQAQTLWRYMIFLFTFILVSLISRSIGVILGVTFAPNLLAAIFSSTVITLIVLIFSNLVVRVAIMPPVLQFISRFNFLYEANNVVFVTLYGYGRCGSRTQTSFLAIKQLLSASIGSFLNLVNKELHSSYNNDSYAVLENWTFSNINDESVGPMTYALVDTILVGAGAGNAIKFGKINSVFLEYFDINEDHMLRSISLLLLHLIFYRSLSYLIMLRNRNA
ncbi:ABC transporter sub-family G-like protein 1 [Dinothrombium tinctorium]|uniref:ABC transporter sub-family G-like protein 1 n=1 Tax=Dinothrombium tinctorium TaxID=1965070 RepID=A0A3S4QSJ5_9ACAR|nr:ABC transporter sub-family G-like protein 1 [Dinothrombium tinctorium]